MKQVPASITTHPDYEARRHYCDLLRERLLRLILEKDELLNTVVPNIEAEFQLRVGHLMYEKFCLQTEINKSKRSIEIIQTAINHGENMNQAAVEEILEMEFREWEDRLKEHLQMIENARAIESSRLSLEESRRISELYRKLVKRLHPDVNPEVYALNKTLWDQVQDAYIRSDTEILEALWLIAQDLDESKAVILTTMEQLQMKENDLKKGIKDTNSVIEGIKSRHPYILREKLADRSWVKDQQRTLDKEISELSVQKSRFRIMADQMIRKHCHE